MKVRTLLPLAALAFAAACADNATIPNASTAGPAHPRLASGSGAGFTSVNESVDGTGHCANGNPNVNCNIYDSKTTVWLNGGPTGANLDDGNYFFAVLAPSGQNDPNDGGASNLSDPAGGDAYTNRVFNVTGGVVGYSGSHDFDSDKIRLVPYDDTPNSGGVYILAICKIGAAQPDEGGNITGYDGYPADPNACKYDAFRIGANGAPEAGKPGVDKTVSASYDNTYAWTIDKAVDKTFVEQVGGTVTFNYTVQVTHDGGTVGNIKLGGNITVSNPNPTSIVVDSITDRLSDGNTCSVSPSGGAQTLVSGDNHFTYTCALSTLPQGQLDNTVRVFWSEQFLDDGSHLAADSATFTVSAIVFTPNDIDECINVTDSFKGALGSDCVGDANPKSFPYSRTVNVTPSMCVNYDNTATFTTTDTHATGSDSVRVTVCGAVAGGLTMGFWQNKNGQGIITNYCAGLAGTSLRTFLRTYNPYMDLGSTATCAQIATYVTNIIKAANSSGSSMNAMLKAQMLATALDVYFSDPTLGGNKIGAPVPLGGVKVDLLHICKMIDGSGGVATCSGTYYDVSSSFGGSPSLTISAMLTFASGQSNSGGSIWYGQVKAAQEKAKDAFDAINNGVAFTAP
jgi:uncharacterized membrane protein YeaQ/YmgE (transglycosylase-associated protein family)